MTFPAVRESRRSDAPPGEAPFTLTQEAPRTLGVLDQLSFWGNLGISLLGFGAAVAIAAPPGVLPLPMSAAVLATVVGTFLGSAVLGGALVIGARTGAPAMVVLRGLLGARASALPTVLNMAQCLGWGAFELVVIAQGLDAVTAGAVPQKVGVVIAGLVTVALTIRPLGAIRVLRRYVAVLVILAIVVLAVGLLRGGTAGSGTGPTSWQGFWLGVDAAAAVAISWVPLGADYSRHSTSPRAAFLGGFAGFGVTQVACYTLGLLALVQAGGNPDSVFDVMRALPLGVLALAVLVVRETDQSFANVYSTAVSLQNLRPTWDRRILTVVVGTVVVLAALLMDVTGLASFLYLLGAVFVPLSAVLLVVWWRTGRDGWDTSETAPTRPAALVAWAVGAVTYQLLNPGAVPGWSDVWTAASDFVHLEGHPWMSASITSFAVAGVIALIATARRTRPTAPAASAAPDLPAGANP
jgi:putative hydroxymethylpyrimidine transporter CytX